jgi:hypothetical protein
MKSREEILDIYVSQYGNDIAVRKISNPFYIPDEQSIVESIEKTRSMYFQYLPEIELNEEEKSIVTNKIKSIHSIYQEEGHAILGDYDHDYTWFDNLLSSGLDEYYWERYKHYLATQKHFAPEVIKTLEEKTLTSLMSYLGNPNDSESAFSVRGLVVGDVQSGKTSNYLGLLTRAADAGYRVIFVLTGTIESLRKQTQERVEEGFVGYDVTNAMDVGVGRGERTPKSFTSRDKDFVAGDDQNTTYKISSYPSEPMIFVVKKNSAVLKKIYTSLKNINTNKLYDKIDAPMLLIDDEADNASINTHKPEDDPTTINRYIRNILSLFTKNSYVGFTATPFANVFISYSSEDEMLKDDLFPRDFIYSLEAPSNYCGSRKYFFSANDNVRYITDYDENVFPMKHKKEWTGDRLFDSLYHAINTFMISNVIRDLRDINKRTNRSMLINMTRFTRVQSVIKDIVDEYYGQLRNAVKQTRKLDLAYALTNPIIESLKASFDKEYGNIICNGTKLTFETVLREMFDSIKDVEIVVVNSSKQSAKLNYDKYKSTGLRVIAIGGLALSRGLTLEGLIVSYFYRNTSTFDVLMQMGRWFGYREGYADICKIYITKESASYYRYICESIEDLRKDIKAMELQHKKPEDYGIRVRNDSIDLGITAANKSRNTKKQVYRKSFYGNIFETPYLHSDLDVIDRNIRSTLEFLGTISATQRKEGVNHPYYTSIPKAQVIKLLQSISVHKLNENFDTKQLLKFLGRNDHELDNFDVLIMGGQKDSPRRFTFEKLGIDVPLVYRNFDIPEGETSIIRMSGQRTRLGGPADAKNGLSRNEIPTGERIKAQDYLIKGRNPLLIFYFVHIDNTDMSNEEIHSSISDRKEEIRVKRELLNRRYNYLVGYAIGFPHKDGATGENITYTVNKMVNYFEKDHDDEGDEGNE